MLVKKKKKKRWKCRMSLRKCNWKLTPPRICFYLREISMMFNFIFILLSFFSMIYITFLKNWEPSIFNRKWFVAFVLENLLCHCNIFWKSNIFYASIPFKSALADLIVRKMERCQKDHAFGLSVEKECWE